MSYSSDLAHAARGKKGKSLYTPKDNDSASTFDMRMRLINNENASLPAKPCTCCIHGGSQRGGTMAPVAKCG